MVYLDTIQWQIQTLSWLGGWGLLGFSSFCDFFFSLPKIRGAKPPGPSPRSITGANSSILSVSHFLVGKLSHRNLKTCSSNHCRVSQSVLLKNLNIKRRFVWNKIASLRSWRDFVCKCFCFGSKAVNVSGEGNMAANHRLPAHASRQLCRLQNCWRQPILDNYCSGKTSFLDIKILSEEGKLTQFLHAAFIQGWFLLQCRFFLMLGYSLAFMPFLRRCGKCQLGLRYVSTTHCLGLSFIPVKYICYKNRLE